MKEINISKLFRDCKEDMPMPDSQSLYGEYSNEEIQRYINTNHDLIQVASDKSTHIKFEFRRRHE